MVENRCLVGGLGWDTDEGTLKDACSVYGEVLDVQIIVYRHTGTPTGHVTFLHRESMLDAIDGMDGMALDANYITVKQEINGTIGAGHCCCFVAGLAQDTHEHSPPMVIRDSDTGQSRRFGFVTFVHKDSAQSAIRNSHGMTLDGSTIWVYGYDQHKPRGDVLN